MSETLGKRTRLIRKKAASQIAFRQGIEMDANKEHLRDLRSRIVTMASMSQFSGFVTDQSWGECAEATSRFKEYSGQPISDESALRDRDILFFLSKDALCHAFPVFSAHCISKEADINWELLDVLLFVGHRRKHELLGIDDRLRSTIAELFSGIWLSLTDFQKECYEDDFREAISSLSLTDN
jgi:hypothetical protein